MTKLETEIEITAPPSQVWQILTDFESFSEWNPLLQATGKAELGEKIAIKANAPDGSDAEYKFQVQIVDFEPNKILAWKGGIPGILSGYHYWLLSASDNGTRLIHGEDFNGLYVLIKGKQHIMSFRPGYEAMNEAMAKRVLVMS